MQVPITVAVGYRRLQTRIPFFDGGDRILMRCIRAHGNFTETVPISLLAMTGAELTGAPQLVALERRRRLTCRPIGTSCDPGTLRVGHRQGNRHDPHLRFHGRFRPSHAIRNALAGVKRTGVGRVRTLSRRANRLPVWYPESSITT